MWLVSYSLKGLLIFHQHMFTTKSFFHAELNNFNGGRSGINSMGGRAGGGSEGAVGRLTPDEADRELLSSASWFLSCVMVSCMSVITATF